ncbi:DoxX family protein [Streptomyces zingiberis]|uniref:DoxX family protein n=1 Tax=Streptomyces zingiberis TaxID=2053010 RepID=UPI0035D49CE5
MSALRWIARPLMASVFVYSGINTLRNPEAVAPAAENVVGPLSDRVDLPLENTEQAVRLNSAVQVVAGTMLGLGKFPRLSALALAGSLAPTTLAGHRFWESEDTEDRTQQRIHFLKNLSIFGGLLLAASDTGGRPSLNWRAQHAAHTARREMKLVRRTASAAGKRPRLGIGGPSKPAKHMRHMKGSVTGQAEAARKAASAAPGALLAAAAPVAAQARSASRAGSQGLSGAAATVKPRVKQARRSSRAARKAASKAASGAASVALDSAAAASKAASKTASTAAKSTAESVSAAAKTTSRTASSASKATSKAASKAASKTVSQAGAAKGGALNGLSALGSGARKPRFGKGRKRRFGKGGLFSSRSRRSQGFAVPSALSSLPAGIASRDGLAGKVSGHRHGLRKLVSH